MDKLFSGAIRLWQDFLDSLNSDGGHVLLLAIFVLLCVRIQTLAGHIELFAGALLGYLKAAGSNKTRRDRLVPQQAVEIVSTQQTETAKAEPKEEGQ